MIRTAAILPAYNEEITIGSIVLSAKKYVDKVRVIDDGSKDDTGEIAKIAGAKVIKHFKNRGKGAALRTGFKNADKYDIIITLDSDGQHNPKEIPKLIDPIIKGNADIVNGSRYLNGQNNKTPFYRRLGQRVLDNATSFKSGINITDSQSGFRAFSRNTVPVFRFNSSDYSIESEMLMDVANNGFKIEEVEIGVRYDVNGSSKNPFSHGIGVLMKILLDFGFQRKIKQ